MIFKDTKRFSPVIYGNDLPRKEDYFHLPPEAINTEVVRSSIIDVQWWEKQRERCLYGYTVPDVAYKGGDFLIDGRDVIWDGEDAYLPEYDLVIKNHTVWISGRFYFYLNFWPIYGIKEGMIYKDLINPAFLMMDFLFFSRWEYCIRHLMDDLELKARQLGFSEKVGGGLVSYNYTFIPSSVNIIVAGVSDDSEHMFENCTRGLDYLRNTQFYKVRSINQLDGLYIKSKNFKSEIRALTAKDNEQAVSRFTPTLIVYEEIGKWKKGSVKKVKKYVDISLKTTTKKTGWSVFIGTGGDMKAGAADLEKIVYNPRANNIPEYFNQWSKRDATNMIKVGNFVPKWWYKVLDEDGNPYKEKSIELIKKEIANVEPEDRITETSQQACYLEDVFLVAGGGFFGDVIVGNLNARKSDILTHKDLRNKVKRYNLYWIDPKNWWKGVYYEVSDNGWALISELPETDKNGIVYENLYGAGTDSYDYDEALTSSSKGACWIYKGFLDANHTYNKWVAGILERPETSVGGAEVFYEHTCLLIIMYRAKNLIEWSKILIFDFYKRNNMSSFLKERPEMVLSTMINDSKQVNKYGIDPATKPEWLKILRDHLSIPENIENIDFVELCEAYANFKYDPTGKKYNCDITIATSLDLVLKKDETFISVQSTEQKQKRRNAPVYVTNERGILVKVYDYEDN